MPNFWSRTVQKIKESIAGPRTNDSELTIKLEEINDYEKAMKKLKSIIINFSNNFQSILEFNSDLTECIQLLYKNHDFREFSDILISVHTDNLNKIQCLVNNLIIKIESTSKLNQKVVNWENFFDEIKDLSKLAEESRKVYDHYEKKLEYMEDKKIEMIREGKFNETCEFYKIILRNEEKFVKSKEDYINKAIRTYDTIERLDTEKYYVISPVLLDLFNNELKMYESVSNRFCLFKNLEEKLNSLKQKFAENNRNKKSYNPLKFMKNPNIDERFVKLNENSFQQVRINSEECKVNMDNSNVKHETSLTSNIVLINFDEAFKSETSEKLVNENDIFANFQINYKRDKGINTNQEFSELKNKFSIPAKRDSVESTVSRFSKFPTYKSIIAEYSDGNDAKENEFKVGKIVNSNTSVVGNTINNPSVSQIEYNFDNNIDFLNVLEKSNKDGNQNDKRKNTNKQMEIIDPFEGLY